MLPTTYSPPHLIVFSSLLCLLSSSSSFRPLLPYCNIIIIGVILLNLSKMASTHDERENILNIASYNSKGFSDNRIETIKELLAYNNIVFIQEHWQFEEQLHKLNIDNRHMAIAVSGMDSSSHIQLGRPYGGVAIIWDKNINNYIQSIDTESKRVAAVLFTNATVQTVTYYCLHAL